MIALKRAYDPASRQDGVRFLVERLWPRGVNQRRKGLQATSFSHASERRAVFLKEYLEARMEKHELAASAG